MATDARVVVALPPKTSMSRLSLGRPRKKILALFGEPDYRSTQGSGNEALSYYMHSLGPPYPMWLRDASLRNRNGMLIFLMDRRGLFVRYSVTSQPPP